MHLGFDLIDVVRDAGNGRRVAGQRFTTPQTRLLVLFRQGCQTRAQEGVWEPSGRYGAVGRTSASGPAAKHILIGAIRRRRRLGFLQRRLETGRRDGNVLATDRLGGQVAGGVHVVGPGAGRSGTGRRRDLDRLRFVAAARRDVAGVQIFTGIVAPVIRRQLGRRRAPEEEFRRQRCTCR